MEYKEKFRIAKTLYSVDNLEVDLQLLAQVNPSSSLLSKPITDSNRAARAEEVVWELLDFVSPEHVVGCRQNPSSHVAKQQPKGRETKKTAPVKKKSPRKRSILISRGLAFISTMYKRLTSSTTIASTPTSKWRLWIRSSISALRRRI